MNQKLLFSSALLVGIAGTQQALAQKKKVQDQKKTQRRFLSWPMTSDSVTSVVTDKRSSKLPT